MFFGYMKTCAVTVAFILMVLSLGNTIEAGYVENVSVIPDELTVTVYQGRFQDATLTIKNLTNSPLDLTVEASNGFLVWIDRGLMSITFSPDSFVLPANGTEVVVTVTTDVLMPAGTYTGKITISDNTTEIIVPTTIEVLPSSTLFDVRIKALTKVLYPSQTLEVEMDLMNLYSGR